jgi:uroporphyrinogen decarboxylase
MMAQTPKEVYKSAAKRIAPERLPTTVSADGILRRDAGYTVESFFHAPPEEQARLTIDAHDLYGGDSLYTGYSGTIAIRALGGKVVFRDHGFPDVEEPLIESISELDKIDISKIKDDFYYQSTVNTARELVRQGGDRYNIQVGSWGVFTQAGLIYGAERLMRATVKDKAAVHALLEWTLELFKACQGEIVALGGDTGSFADPSASGDMISLRTFEEFSLPYIVKLTEWFNARGLLTQLHICGDINDRIPVIADSGVDVLSVDYKVDIVKAAKTLHGKAVIGGNADPVAVILEQNADSVKKVYADTIAALDGEPYIVMAGCGIPANTPVENIRAINELAYTARPRYNL